MNPPVIYKIFDRSYCDQMYNYIVTNQHNPKYFYEDNQVPEALTIKTEMFKGVTTKYNNIRPPTDIKTKPTNWYGRLYLKGNELKRHYDGDHCDHSLTITMGYSGENWPIWIDGVPYKIPIGHGAYYRGCDMEHWREPLEGDNHLQLFFHYVLE